MLAPYLYNIYTEDLFPGNINTSIIAFADDLILVSLNLHQRQSLVNECVEFGKEHCIRFNGPKTQFLISGVSPLPNPQILLETSVVNTKTEMKHLGFK